MQIENFNVKGFKKFEDFTLNELKLVNIFLGDNNIGKTSLLEALLFNEDLKTYLYNLSQLISWRFNLKRADNSLMKTISDRYLQLYFNKSNNNPSFELKFQYKGSKINKSLKFSIIKTDALVNHEIQNFKTNSVSFDDQIPLSIIKFQLSEKNNIYAPTNFQLVKGKQVVNYLPYIKSNILYNSDIISFFSVIEGSRAKLLEFIDSLRFLIPNIDDIRLDATNPDLLSLSIFEKNIDGAMPLATMGDGTIRLFRVLLEIEQCKDQRLMIDEIDNGLHFSRQKEFWKVILNSAKLNNTQLFITTHSSECLKSLKNAIEEMDDVNFYKNETICYTLYENVTNKLIENIRYNFTEFEACIQQDIEMRK